MSEHSALKSNQQSSAQDSPAKDSVRQVKEKGSTMTGRVFGGRSTGLLGSYDQGSYVLRTHQYSLFGGLTPYSDPLPKSGMMRNGHVYQLNNAAHPTSANEHSLLHTPTTMDAKTSGYQKKEFSYGKLGCLAQQLEGGHLKLPTPTCQDAKNDGSPSQFRRNSLPLNAIVHLIEPSGPGSLLSPLFVEEMMGFEMNYTAIEESD